MCFDGVIMILIKGVYIMNRVLVMFLFIATHSILLTPAYRFVESISELQHQKQPTVSYATTLIMSLSPL